jgi:hypothetical protein
MVHSTFGASKTIFLAKCTAADKYQKSVPIFGLIIATTRLSAHPSFTVPEA